MPGQQQVLNALEQGPKTTRELHEKFFSEEPIGNVGQALSTLRDAGKVEQDGKGKPWRLAGTSPASEETESTETDADPPQSAASKQDQILALLPASKAALVATLGWTDLSVSGCLAGLKRNGLAKSTDGRGGAWTALAKGRRKAEKAKASNGHVKTNGHAPAAGTVVDASFDPLLAALDVEVALATARLAKLSAARETLVS